MSLPDEDLKGSFSQCLSVFIREISIASFDKIMVEGGVGVFSRADSHDGEVKVVDGVGGDRGGDRRLLPLFVRFANQDSCSNETETHDQKPKNLC